MPRSKNKRSGSKRIIKAAVNRSKRIMSGGPIRVKNDPPGIVTRPWFNVCVLASLLQTWTLAVPANWNFSLLDLRSALQSQLGFTSSSLEIKIRRFRVYMQQPLGQIENEFVPTLKVDVYDIYNQSSTAMLCSMQDQSPAIAFNRVGYIYPKDVQIDPLDSTQTLNLIRIKNPKTAQNGRQTFLIYFDVSFRIAEAAALTFPATLYNPSNDPSGEPEQLDLTCELEKLNLALDFELPDDDMDSQDLQGLEDW